MIVITGAAGFIGSVLLSYFNRISADTDIIIVDDFSIKEKEDNYLSKKWIKKVERDTFFTLFDKLHEEIDFVFHLGARTDTVESDVSIFEKLNLNYSKQIWEKCSSYDIPLVYASSAATYGNGENGYRDDHELVEKLLPLNTYGISKNEFDKWVLRRKKTPPFWVGLKFFNVYGPNEYHKDRMASVIVHAFNQIRVTKEIKLFKSHRCDYENGQQARDFIYVKDIAKLCHYLYTDHATVKSGIYNLGTGIASTYESLALSVFKSMGLQPLIKYIDIPEDIRKNYQYYTRAEMDKLIGQGIDMHFCSLEDGIDDYIKNYLFAKNYY